MHLALNEKTRGLVNADVFDRMKPGAFFVNTARGEVVDYKALEAAVKEKGLRVALDVYSKEPAMPTGDFVDALDRAARRVRHAPHRRLDGAGAAGHRGRDGAHHRDVPRAPAACRTW